MNDSMITFTGYLGTAPQVRTVGDVTVANFRVGSTPRRFNRESGEWENGETQWYSVAAWRTLGEHCAASLRVGDAVVVHGRMSVEVWQNKAGQTSTSFEVDASFVGHDLNRGTSAFTRLVRTEAGAVDAATGEIRSEREAEAA